MDASLDHFPEDAQIEVMPDAWFSNQAQLTAFREARPLADMLQELPDAKPEKQHKEKDIGAKKLKVGKVPDYLMENHPWLGELLRSSAHKDRPRGHASEKDERSTPAAPSTQAVRPQLSAEDEQATWDALTRLRNQWRDQIDLDSEHFPIALRGGVWTQQHRGTEADCVSVSARRGVAWSWCERYSLPKMARFTLQYTTPIANALASEWAKRMQHFFNIHLTANDHDFVYSETDLTSYAPSAEWQAMLASMQNRKALARANGINAILPVNPAI